MTISYEDIWGSYIKNKYESNVNYREWSSVKEIYQYLPTFIEKLKSDSVNCLNDYAWDSRYFGSELYINILNRLRVLHRCNRIALALDEQEIPYNEFILDILYSAKHIYIDTYLDDDGGAWEEYKQIEHFVRTAIKNTIPRNGTLSKHYKPIAEVVGSFDDHNKVSRRLSYGTYQDCLKKRSTLGNSILNEKLISLEEIGQLFNRIQIFENTNPVAIAARAVRGTHALVDCPCRNFIQMYIRHHEEPKISLYLYSILLAIRDGTKIHSIVQIISKIRSQPKGIQVIEYFSFFSDLNKEEECTIVACVEQRDPKKVTFDLIQMENVKLYEKTKDYIAHFESCKNLNTSFKENDLIDFGELIIGKVLNETAEKCIITPSPPLRNFPFESLCLSGTFMGLSHIISYQSSSPILQNNKSEYLPDFSNFYAIGACDYDADVGFENSAKVFGLPGFGCLFEGLQSAAKEVKMLESYQAKILSGTGVTKENLSKITSISILHIASHAFYRQSTNIFNAIDSLAYSPEHCAGIAFPAIALTGINAGINDDGAVLFYADGMLSIPEISNIGIRKGALILLSCCEAGLSDLDAVGNHIGLREAFEISGAGWVISSMWAIDDDGTLQFCEELYKHLSTGRKVDEALWLARKGTYERIPFSVWGAFTAYRTTIL